MSTEDTPESVEEAGALLGAAITKCNATQDSDILTPPPKGMHSSFSTVSPVPSSELFCRLYQLRSLLRSSDRNVPLVAAPSLLAVLMKLLSVSSNLALQFVHDCRIMTPPLWSVPLRRLWVDCVVLCHVLGESLSGKATRIDIYAFVRNMVALAGLNPKSNKAAGGTRIAALQVIGGLFVELPLKLAPWALDVFQLCHRSLKSSGNGEPTYRIAAIRTATDAAIACREAQLQSKRSDVAMNPLLLKGAMEDRAILEVIKLIKSATSDKYPEVRHGAANLTSVLAPLLVLSSTSSSDPSANTTASLEELIGVAQKSLDDERTGVAIAWAEAQSRLLTTSIVYGTEVKTSTESNSRRSDEGDGTGEENSADDKKKSSSSRKLSITQVCNSLPATVNYLVDLFVKAGGENSAFRMGGPFSTGGRAVRMGLALVLNKLLRLQSVLGNVSEEYGMKRILCDVLKMLGPDVLKQLSGGSGLGIGGVGLEELEAQSSKTNIFGSRKSPADSGLARHAVGRVLREGLSEVAAEPTQLKFLQEFTALLMEKDSLLNVHQKQVVLIEISHLITTLGQAAGNALNELIPVLQHCIAQPHHGVRHEAAIACAAIAVPFPGEARKMYAKAVEQLQVQHAELVTLASMELEETSTKSKRSRFMRKEEEKMDKSLTHQFAIHGNSIVIAILLRELPALPGGLPKGLINMGLSVAEILIRCQYMDLLTSKNPSGACTCVRSGFGIICGALAAGADAMAPHIGLLFDLWEKSGESIKDGSKNFSMEHDLICFDATLSSIVAFLEHCSQLLLVMPDALSRTTLLLEQMLPLFLPHGRLGAVPSSPAAASRHESAKSCIMEAFAWLPPGSFPTVANQVFAFSLAHIQSGTEAEVTCSILTSLVNNEDRVLDTKTISRAQRYWEIGGARDLEDNLLVINSEIAHHGERESVLHFQSHALQYKDDRNELRGSRVLGLWAFDEDDEEPPTPLHAVGTWKHPESPSCSSKVRLIDAAVQAFSATFGLKDGKEQQQAMILLESLVPPLMMQLAKAIGVNSKLSENDRRNKQKDDNAAIANITAVLLACLKALPLHEATHDVPISLGPPWMNNAKDLLLTLLPSASNIVRRAASEGLALLATLGVSEDAHTLQSSVLHSLDEVMQGNTPDGKPRAIPLEPVTVARAGSLLTLGCIQRTAFNIEKKHQARQGRRSSKISAGGDDEALPTMQMMTRILPSIACHAAIRDAFVVRTYAMHSFVLLISYSSTLKTREPTIEDKQLIRKAVEVVLDNFLACWTAVSATMDKGQEPGKLAAEAKFVAVILRTMTFLVPNLKIVEDEDTGYASQFSRIATVILEEQGMHPIVLTEAFAFFEVLAGHQHLLPPASTKVLPSENLLTSSVPFLVEAVRPNRPKIHSGKYWDSLVGVMSTPQATRHAMLCIKILSNSDVLNQWMDSVPQTLFAALEAAAGSRTCGFESFYRQLAVSREANRSQCSRVALEAEIVNILDTVLSQEAEEEATYHFLIRWILLSRVLANGVAEKIDEYESGSYTKHGVTLAARKQAIDDSEIIFETTSACRWQVKAQAVRSGAIAMKLLGSNPARKQIQVNPQIAETDCKQKCKDSLRQQSVLPSSYLVFHLPEVLSAASGAVVATIDQFELRFVQEGGVRFLTELIDSFGAISDPDELGVSLLEQYSSQILSSVKHALGAASVSGEEKSNTLFYSGCKALETTIQKELIADVMAFKRMVRPLLPSKGEMAFFSFAGAATGLRVSSDDLASNCRNSLLPLIGRVGSIARIHYFVDMGSIKDDSASFLAEETRSSMTGLACRAAAIAIDGALLLQRNDEPELDGPGAEAKNTAKLMAANVQDMDDDTKSALVAAWAPCAYYAAANFSKVMDDESADESEKEGCKEWTTKLIPALLFGVETIKGMSGSMQLSTSKWARFVNVDTVVSFSLRGLAAISHSTYAELIAADLRDVMLLLSQVLLESSPDGNSEASMALVKETCMFYESVAQANLGSKGEAALITIVLKKLDDMQKGKMNLGDAASATVAASFLRIAKTLVGKPSTSETIVNAVMQLSLELLSSKDNVNDEIREASEALLTACFQTESVSTAKQQSIARTMAKQGKWETWIGISSRSKEALLYSIGPTREALADLSNATRHTAALTACQSLMRSGTSEMASVLMQGVGPEVLGLFVHYGVTPGQFRTQVCADCMKIFMIGYNQLVGNDASLGPFLGVIFDAWIGMIQYNGLPNQASPQPSADPNLGRMAAQAIVHVARTSPTAFKSTIVGLEERPRAILEFAVRADMSGYASTAAPVKKTLNIKSFKR